jgi:hypothetical protein
MPTFLAFANGCDWTLIALELLWQHLPCIVFFLCLSQDIEHKYLTGLISSQSSFSDNHIELPVPRSALQFILTDTAILEMMQSKRLRRLEPLMLYCTLYPCNISILMLVPGLNYR